MKDTPDNLTTPAGFIALSPAQVEADRRSGYAYAFTGPDAPIDEDEVLAYLRKRRGNVFLVAAVELLDSRAATVRALTMRADSADWTAEALAVESRVLRVAVTALTTRALLAEARVKEMQAELSEQERDKLALLIELGSRAA